MNIKPLPLNTPLTALSPFDHAEPHLEPLRIP